MDKSAKYALWILVILFALYLLAKFLRYEDCISGYMQATGLSRDIVKMYC
jgi:hypothetical protein